MSTAVIGTFPSSQAAESTTETWQIRMVVEWPRSSDDRKGNQVISIGFRRPLAPFMPRDSRVILASASIALFDEKRLPVYTQPVGLSNSAVSSLQRFKRIHERRSRLALGRGPCYSDMDVDKIFQSLSSQPRFWLVSTGQLSFIIE
jgi:hypothetical protein